MGKYDFIKLGNLLYWHDPDSGLSNGVTKWLLFRKTLKRIALF